MQERYIHKNYYVYEQRRNNCLSWWRHQKHTFSALLNLCEGNPAVTGGFPRKGQWRRALEFPLICTWTNGLSINRGTGDSRRRFPFYDVTVIIALSTGNRKLGLSWKWVVGILGYQLVIVLRYYTILFLRGNCLIADCNVIYQYFSSDVILK